MTWVETFPCDEICGEPLSDKQRAVQRCGRADLPVVAWRDGEAVTDWMGLPPDNRARDRGEPFWHRPHEPIDHGCPGAWYRSGFAASLDPYLPTPTAQGWTESPLLHRDSPRLIIDACQLYRRERARVMALEMEVLHES